MTSYKITLWRVVLMFLFLLAPGCRFGEKRTEEDAVLKITMAVSKVASSSLIAVAEEKGFFEEEGLEVIIDTYPSGRDALEAIIAGNAQVSTVADIAFVTKISQEPALRIFASIGTTLGSRIVARKDRHIALPADLQGKKIGYSAGTVSDYFLYAYLLTEDIPTSDIEAVDIPPSRQVESIVSGEVDAVSAFENYAYEAVERLGGNAVSWQTQNNLAYHWLLVTKKNIAPSSEALIRLLRALIKAEDYARENMAEVTDVVAEKWGYDPDYLRAIWPKNRLTVSFGQSMVSSLENFVLWEQQRKGIIDDTFDVLDYFDTTILEKVAPERIGIYR